MTRVDRYNDDTDKSLKKDVPLSRVLKHQNMYDEIYMNTTLVDINNILPEVEERDPISEIKKEVETEPEVYEEKSYSVNEYLEKAHERNDPDNAKRDINSVEFKEQEDEIRKLIDSINEKEESEDFFKDLKGDNEDTLVGAKMKTDDFNNSIYEALKEKTFDGATVLDRVLGDETVLNLEQEEEKKIDHTFEEILKSDNRIRNKRKQLPIIIFSITLFILIVVVLIVVLK